jgi:hypothetical protein
VVSEVGVCRCESGGNRFLDKFVKSLIGNNFFLKFITSVWKLVITESGGGYQAFLRRGGALLQKTVNRCSNPRLPFCGTCKSCIDRST